jgi:hypothetical protein
MTAVKRLVWLQKFHHQAIYGQQWIGHCRRLFHASTQTPVNIENNEMH